MSDRETRIETVAQILWDFDASVPWAAGGETDERIGWWKAVEAALDAVSEPTPPPESDAYWDGVRKRERSAPEPLTPPRIPHYEGARPAESFYKPEVVKAVESALLSYGTFRAWNDAAKFNMLMDVLGSLSYVLPVRLSDSEPLTPPRDARAPGIVKDTVARYLSDSPPDGWHEIDNLTPDEAREVAELAIGRARALEGALRALVAASIGDSDSAMERERARALAAESTPPAPKAERADHPRCEVALAYDDSIGGEGLIRCNWSLDENGRCTNPDQAAHRKAAPSTPNPEGR